MQENLKFGLKPLPSRGERFGEGFGLYSTQTKTAIDDSVDNGFSVENGNLKLSPGQDVNSANLPFFDYIDVTDEDGTKIAQVSIGNVCGDALVWNIENYLRDDCPTQSLCTGIDISSDFNAHRNLNFSCGSNYTNCLSFN